MKLSLHFFSLIIPRKLKVILFRVKMINRKWCVASTAEKERNSCRSRSWHAFRNINLWIHVVIPGTLNPGSTDLKLSDQAGNSG